MVSSGENVAKVVNRYKHMLNINHIHTEYSGQSLQKTLAIKSLNNNIDWVFFIDDDLILTSDTLSRVEKRILKLPNASFSGIGTRLISQDESFGKINFGIANSLFSKNHGTIRKSGRAIKYMYDELNYPEWLNGASIWRIECLEEYKLPVLDSRYAAYEDVIFSSKMANVSKLVYDPEIEVVEQIPHKNLNLSFSQLKYISLWTGFLVCSRLETRLINYKCLILFRATKFLFFGGSKQLLQNCEFHSFSNFMRTLIFLPMSKLKANEIILSLLRSENSKSQS